LIANVFPRKKTTRKCVWNLNEKNQGGKGRGREPGKTKSCRVKGARPNLDNVDPGKKEKQSYLTTLHREEHPGSFKRPNSIGKRGGT